MQIVISVPDEWLEGTQPNLYDVMGAVMNGTVLPEHHGRLIEDNVIADEFVCGKDDSYYQIISKWIKLQPTIIPATKEGAG